MSGSTFSVSPGVVCERVGDELMIVVPGHSEVVKLTGEAAEVFLDIQAGRTPRASGKLTSDLEALGIIEASGMSRRGLIKAGAIGVGAGIAVLAMPGVAAASSSAELTGFGIFNQGIANDAVVAEFGVGTINDLFIVVLLDYDSSDVPEPTSRLTGTITSNQFSGPRDAVFLISEGYWVALVSSPVGSPPITGSFELSYGSNRVTGDIIPSPF